MPVALRISYDRPTGAYYAGETLSGRVHLRVDEPTRIRGITVTFTGEALAKRRKRYCYYTLTHVILQAMYPSTTKTLLNSKQDLLAAEVELSPGDHEYAFQCPLGHNLPSSFQDKLGHIAYKLNASVTTSRGARQDLSQVFVVVEPVDLNALPEAAEPIYKKDSKFFYSLWQKSGPLAMSLQVPSGGYIPGQTIAFQVNVSNASTYVVEEVSVKLTQVVEWNANCERTWTFNVLDKVVLNDSRLEENDSKSFTGVVSLRPVPPSPLKNKCSLFHWEYVLRATARVNGAHLNLHVRAPILVGTTPLALK